MARLMAQGTRKSTWTVAFHPVSGHHMSYDPGFVTVYRGDERVTIDTDQLIAHAELEMSLTFKRFERGRSSVVAIMDGEQLGVVTTGWLPEGTRRPFPSIREFAVSLAEFEKLVPDLRKGVVWGRWGFAKNGSNTFLVRLP